MSEHLLGPWLVAFTTTVLVEAPIYALWLSRRMRIVQALLLGFALQALTHPVFWLTWDTLEEWPYDHYALAVTLFESVIVLVEALVVFLVVPRDRPWHRLPRSWLALFASLSANATSVLVGLLHEG